MLHGEALGGGSVLNFFQKPLTPEKVADAVWLAHIKQKAEICIPCDSEGMSSKLGNFFPLTSAKNSALLGKNRRAQTLALY
jgi:hypothetical protein